MDDFFSLRPIGRKTRYRDKPYVPHGTYHVFNRREDAEDVFLDDIDKNCFVDGIKRLVCPEAFRDERGRATEPLAGRIGVLAYCVLNDHYHKAVEQDGHARGVSEYMHRLMTSYTKRFNNRHDRIGPVFDLPYQALPVQSRTHLRRLIAYIHANADDPHHYPWSSHQLYMEDQPRTQYAWCDVEAGLRIYGGRENYVAWFERAVEERAIRNREKEMLRRSRRAASRMSAPYLPARSPKNAKASQR